jgi:hypothetical protein
MVVPMSPLDVVVGQLLLEYGTVVAVATEEAYRRVAQQQQAAVALGNQGHGRDCTRARATSTTQQKGSSVGVTEWLGGVLLVVTSR